MTVCAKCHHLRPVDSPAPAWQCPACGVAYAKSSVDITPVRATPPLRNVRTRSGRSWRPLLIAAAVAAGLWWSYQQATSGKQRLALSDVPQSTSRA